MCHHITLKSCLRCFAATMLCLTLLFGRVARVETRFHPAPAPATLILASDDHPH